MLQVLLAQYALLKQARRQADARLLERQRVKQQRLLDQGVQVDRLDHAGDLAVGLLHRDHVLHVLDPLQERVQRSLALRSGERAGVRGKRTPRA